MRILWISLVTVFLDQVSKIIVAHALDLGHSIPVIGDFFRLTYIQNPKGAFSIAFGGKTFHLIASSLAMVFILIVLWKSLSEPAGVRTALALILGGAIGNMLDRIRLGEVIDFLDVEFFNIDFHFWKIHLSLDRWPVFNVADAAVTIGAILLAAIYLVGPHVRNLHGNADSGIGTQTSRSEAT